MPFSAVVSWIICFYFTCLLSFGFSQEEATISFNRDVRPILSENCNHCHGPDPKQRKADLRLDLRDGALQQGAIVPGNPNDSEVIARIFSIDPDDQMPPPDSHRNLTPEQRDVIKQWISQGAAYEPHWAFIPPKKSKVSASKNAIDALVSARLKQEGLSFSEPATPSQLVRRLALDLTGLPPDSELATCKQYLANPNPTTYAAYVDSLLSQPAYGERMAWEWLDAARYADSNGYQGDRERTMWPWRDWVVNAFNENLPYDKFTVWQLAGDLLPDATHEQKLATGFCRNHAINGEGGRIAEENRVEYVMDMAETAGTIWLGLTYNCCRCHDHKYDQLTQAEYFQMFAFFNQTPVSGGGGDPQTAPNLPTPSPMQQAKEAELKGSIQSLEQKKRVLKATLNPVREAWETAAKKTQSTWQVLLPSSAVSVGKQTMKLNPDGSIFVSGKNPAKDDYEIECPLTPGRYASLRLEALRHKSMTKGGLARSDSGNFVLSEIEVMLKTETESQPIKIQSAEASFEQGSLKIRGTFDGNLNTGWAVYKGGAIDQDHEGVFQLKPFDAKDGDSLVVRLRHQSRHVSHNLGHFRISLSSSPQSLQARADKVTALAIDPAKRTTAQKKEVWQVFLSQTPKGTNHLEAIQELKQLQAKEIQLRQNLTTFRKGIPKVMVMQDQSEFRKSYILNRGLYTQPTTEVFAGVPNFLPPLQSSKTNRLALAEWLVSPEQPLTARVTVNRLWQQFFGMGLVKTVEDFGVQGEIPRYQDLLDHLSADFQTDWDVQRLLRQIVASKTYQQSSKVSPEQLEFDPENRWLARGARFRLPFWMIRDQALASSGLLVPSVGGKPVNGYQPPGIWEEATFGKKKYVRGNGDDLYRRSIYTFWRRIIGPPMFFDNASRNVCTVKSLRTNTPLHALLTLNDEGFVEAARALAQTAFAESKRADSTKASDLARLNWMYQRVLLRLPSSEELSILGAALNRTRKQYAEQPAEAEALLQVGDLVAPKDIAAGELASWTSLALAILNFDETLTRE